MGGLILAIIAGCATGNPNIREAESALEEQNYEEALQNVDEALEEEPENANAYILRGRIYLQQASEVEDPQEHTELVEQAVDAWNEAIDIDPDVRSDVENRRLLAYQMEFEQGANAFNQAQEQQNPELFNQAAAYFGGATLVQPDSARPARFQAYAYVQGGSQQEAIEPLSQLVELGEADTTDYTLLGQLYLQDGQVEEAVDVLEEGDEQYPGQEDIQSLLLNAYTQAGMEERAMERYQELVEEEPNNEIYRYNYGSMLLNTERYDEAIEQLQEAVQLDPSYANANFNLGAAYTNKAVELTDRITALNDSLVENQQELSQQEASEIEAEMDELAEERRELFEQAIGPLEEAYELSQADPEAQTNEAEVCRALFTAYVQTGQEDQAREVEECAGMEGEMDNMNNNE